MAARKGSRNKRAPMPKSSLSPEALQNLGLVMIAFIFILIFGILDHDKQNLMGIYTYLIFEPVIGKIGLFILPVALAMLSISLILCRRNRVINALAQYSFFLCFLVLPIINLMHRIQLGMFYHPSDDRLVGVIGASVGSFFELLFGIQAGIIILVVFGLVLIPPVSGYAPSEIIKGIIGLRNHKKKKSRRDKPSKTKRRDFDFDFTEDETYRSDKGLIEDNTASEPVEIVAKTTQGKQEKTDEKTGKELDELVTVSEKEQMELNFKKMLRETGEYEFPPSTLLKEQAHLYAEDDKKALALKIEETLSSFGVEAVVEKMIVGPVIIQCELRLAPGVRVNAVKNLRSELAMALAAKSLRIEAPIPGKDVMGIEFPNSRKKLVTLREMIESDDFKNSQSFLTICIGKDLTGKPLIEDLSKMPHLLIAGQTGAGKSVCLNSIIMSMMYKAAPDEVKMILIDPKRVEMTLYEGLPHLLVPVVQEWHDAKNALIWVAKEMSSRLEKLQKSRCREISSYNKKRPNGDFMQYIVIVIDEFATLMDISSGKEVERLINHLARLARATGIHLILATQRPDVKVITGSIKANIPARIAFSVPAQVDSKTILDRTGADLLLGEGDMLYRGISDGNPRRAQGTYISDDEIEIVVGFLMDQMEPEFRADILKDQGEIDEIEGITPVDDDEDQSFDDNDEDEEYYQEALKIVLRKKRISASLLQREFRIGYNRASRIIDKLEERGIITGMDGQRSRRLIEDNDFIDPISGA